MLLESLLAVITLVVFSWPLSVLGADKLIGIHSARVMSQSLPWVAEEVGLFKKYNLDFHLVFISSSSIVTAALLGGDAEMTLTGGEPEALAVLIGGGIDAAAVTAPAGALKVLLRA